MPFVKVDCGILQSSLWVDEPGRMVFLTALLMAEPLVTDKPMEEYATRGFERTGFSVPPGYYGFVPAASVGILKTAGIPFDEGIATLERLASPDLQSRSPEFEGRRMIRVEGGFLILNYGKYREQDYGAAERMRRYRARKAQQKAGSGYDVTQQGDTVTLRHVTQAEAEAEAEVEDSPSVSRRRRASRRCPSDWQPKEADLTALRAAHPHVDLALEEQKMRDYEFRTARSDWDACYRNWVRRAALDQKPRLTRYEQLEQARRGSVAAPDSAMIAFLTGGGS